MQTCESCGGAEEAQVRRARALRRTPSVSHLCAGERRSAAYLTRRWALRESLPPTDVTLQVYVPMSPDQVWEMCRVPSGSVRMRGIAWTLITDPSFSQTCLKEKARYS